MPQKARKFLCVLVVAASPAPVLAQPPVGVVETDQSVFVFGGRYTANHAIDSVFPLSVTYEDNYVLGAGYQRFFLEPWDNFKIGLEAGAAARIADPFSGEIWGGAVMRYDGIVLDDKWRISPAVTIGLSAVTGSFGAEEERRALTGGDAHLLFYLGPEISVGSVDGNDEFFYRIQHRSGAWELLNHMGDGANAQVIGFRHKF